MARKSRQGPNSLPFKTRALPHRITSQSGAFDNERANQLRIRRGGLTRAMGLSICEGKRKRGTARGSRRSFATSGRPYPSRTIERPTNAP
jgi:hypothetical protein